MNSVFFCFVVGGLGGYGDCSMIRNGWIFGYLQTLQTQSMLYLFSDIFQVRQLHIKRCWIKAALLGRTNFCCVFLFWRMKQWNKSGKNMWCPNKNADSCC